MTMVSNASAKFETETINYPVYDNNRPFSEYISLTKAIIANRRNDLSPSTANSIIEANSPFELIPANSSNTGALLIHGLLDCPFTLRDIAYQFQQAGILSRAILLPGHGTKPEDLLHVSYHDWIQAVRYGVETLRKDVEKILLVGYSTGAALSVYQALQDTHIAGMILLAPAIKIKAPVDTVTSFRSLTQWLRKSRQWLFKDNEVDYTKYCSIPINPVIEVSKLSIVIRELRKHHPLNTPVLMVMSREDETISSTEAIRFFSNLKNLDNKLLLYTANEEPYVDSRIIMRHSRYPDLNINNFSHVSIPFKHDNSHYGQWGDYLYASHIHSEEFVYGAYNIIDEKISAALFDVGLAKYKRRELTYNPDFNYMANKIISFINGC